jgi:hypothetical protein
MPFLLLATISKRNGFSSLEEDQTWQSSKRIEVCRPAPGFVASNEGFDKFDIFTWDIQVVFLHHIVKHHL